jgi:hypothetical protein
MNAYEILAKLADMRKRARARTGVRVYEYINGQRVSVTHYAHSDRCVMGIGSKIGVRDSEIVWDLTIGAPAKTGATCQ